MVRTYWVDKNESLAKSTADNINRHWMPGEGPIIEVIAKQDLQPLFDQLKYHLEYMTVNNAHRIAEAAQELVEAWEGSNGTK